MDNLFAIGLLIIAAGGFAILRMLDQRANRQYAETTGREPPKDSVGKVIVRWVIILSVGAGAIYAAYWLYSHPTHPITPIGIWIFAAMLLMLPALRGIRIIRNMIDVARQVDQTDRES